MESVFYRYCCFVFCLLACRFVARLGAAQGIALFDAFYRSGALVFGGGHVVLPLLRDAVVTPGWVNDNTFLSGYGPRKPFQVPYSRSPPIWVQW